MRSRLCMATIACASLVTCSSPSFGQSPEPDPEAMKAFAELIKSYRERPALTVTSTVRIQLTQGDVVSTGDEVKGEFIFGPGRTAVVKLRDFTCYLNDGTVTAVHKDTDHAYFNMDDDDSPYYALFNLFLDLPFPELALALGEDEPEEVVMQFHPKCPYVQPTSITVEERNGKKVQVLSLTSDSTEIEAIVDPESKLIQSLDVKITGGDLVQPGTTLNYSHTYEYETHDQPLDDSVFSFDPGDRQKVDVLSDLMPTPEMVALNQGDGDEEHDVLGGELINAPAPPIAPTKADGQAVNLNDLHGRVVVLDFWATWCGPCRQALPLLHQVATWADEQKLQVTILTVNVWERTEKPEDRLKLVKDFWEKQKFTLPVVMDYTDDTAKAYRVRGIPTTVIIRPDGIVHAVHVGGGPNYADLLKQGIQQALKEAKAEM